MSLVFVRDSRVSDLLQNIRDQRVSCFLAVVVMFLFSVSAVLLSSGLRFSGFSA